MLLLKTGFPSVCSNFWTTVIAFKLVQLRKMASASDPLDIHDPGLRALLPIAPDELTRVLRLKQIIQRLGVMVIGQHQHLPGAQCVQGLKYLFMPLGGGSCLTSKSGMFYSL